MSSTPGAATSGGRLAASVGYGASLVLHLALFAWVASQPTSDEVERETIAFDLLEVEPAAPPPAPAPVPSPPERELAPEPDPPVAPRPPPRRERAAAKPPDAPPPPNAPAQEGAPKKAPVRIGVSMSSTTRAGGVAAPVGNTLYGELPREAPRPEDVTPYRDGAVPPAQVSVLPKGGCRDIPRDEYPREAREEGREGVVTLRLLVAEDGRVRDVKVVKDPVGFGAAAVKIAFRHCRFEPARRGDEAVATWITVPMTFVLQ